MTRTLVTAPLYNESARIEPLLTLIRERLPKSCDMLFVDDCSSDSSPVLAEKAGFEVMRHATRRGCGPAVRTGLETARARGYPIAVVMAGNGKDDPGLIPKLLEPIETDRADLVQGSRYLPGGRHANMPFHRLWGTHAYSLGFSLLGGRRISDATNGFRAVRTKLLTDPRIDLHQEWLRDYEVESYLLFRAIQLGYRVLEAPVSKLYPAAGSYTKMRPFAGWWSHFRPALLLALGLKH